MNTLYIKSTTKTYTGNHYRLTIESDEVFDYSSIKGIKFEQAIFLGDNYIDFLENLSTDDLFIVVKTRAAFIKCQTVKIKKVTIRVLAKNVLSTDFTNPKIIYNVGSEDSFIVVHAKKIMISELTQAIYEKTDLVHVNSLTNMSKSAILTIVENNPNLRTLKIMPCKSKILQRINVHTLGINGLSKDINLDNILMNPYIKKLSITAAMINFTAQNKNIIKLNMHLMMPNSKTDGLIAMVADNLAAADYRRTRYTRVATEID